MLDIKKYETKKFKTRCFKSPWLVYDMYIGIFTLSDSSTYVKECRGCDFYDASLECEKCRAIITLMFRKGCEVYGNEILKPDITVLPLNDE